MAVGPLKIKQGAEERRKALQRELERWLPILVSEEDPETIILFGAFAASETNAWSDLDIVVVKETRARFLERHRRLLALWQPRVGMDILVYTPEGFDEPSWDRAFVPEDVVGKGRVL